MKCKHGKEPDESCPKCVDPYEARIRADEREACVGLVLKELDKYPTAAQSVRDVVSDMVTAIRARGGGK